MKRRIPIYRRLINKVPAFDRGPNTYFGERALTYVKDRQEDERWVREEQVLSELLRSQGEELRVLDMPAGTGRFFNTLNEIGATTVAIDISRDMLRQARQSAELHSYSADFSVRPAHKTGLAESSFDLVVCMRFFGMLSPNYASKVIKELARVIKPGGLLLLYVVAKDDKAGSDDQSSVARMSELTETKSLLFVERFGFAKRRSHEVGRSAGQKNLIVELEREKNG